MEVLPRGHGGDGGATATHYGLAQPAMTLRKF